ncbi:hypothetical protein ABB29_12670 [Pseudoxanthomonas dokdonensis]|uniref:DUF3348 domain-containing protein n=1 Tax=Pseudoxanthomonas dokdonensis TaxID=344882 RepID=A0A0R0CU97_9GAMM|nr:DUF3348 domain-containing protein [Pseudoxanthomonas dokdonensis]KRG68472.1 hypothetical protein ABB29_12670 [Pseudoxanthomonas dokdonensis]
MANVQQRTPVAGPAFIRQLAQLLQLDVPGCAQPLSERLSQWFDWNRAVALSRALDNPAVAAEPAATTSGSPADEYRRLREGLERSIARLDDPASIVMPPPRNRSDASGGRADFEPFRQHYLGLQRSMLAASGRLRGSLRDLLATRGADNARLAELDAVMEMTISPREQTLLASVPMLLGQHFARLRQAHVAASVSDAGELAGVVAAVEAGSVASDGAEPLAPTAPVTADSGAGADDEVWLASFRRHMQDVLRAELDVRFQPIEGLLAALRHSQAMPS